MDRNYVTVTGKYLLMVLHGCKVLVLKMIQRLTFNFLTSYIPGGMNIGRIIVWTSEIKMYLYALRCFVF